MFLVLDPNGGVMLHNGIRKLGNVSPKSFDAADIRDFIKTESLKRGHDIVLVTSMPPVFDTFKYHSSFNVRIVGMVYERFARKIARFN